MKTFYGNLCFCLFTRIDQKLTKMEAVIAQAKACRVDCSNVDKKFRQLVDLTEDEATFHMRQSAFLYQLAVQTMPKSHHCLSMRLTVEYFRDPSPDIDQSLAERHLNPDLHHFVIFSNNVLASSAVINSTVMHAKVWFLYSLFNCKKFLLLIPLLVFLIVFSSVCRKVRVKYFMW